VAAVSSRENGNDPCQGLGIDTGVHGHASKLVRVSGSSSN